MNFRAQVLIITFVSIFATSVFAYDVCDLQQQAVNVTGISADEISSYKMKLKKECDVYQKFVDVREKSNLLYEIALEDITLYQAMRFVRRVDYQNSKAQNIPVEITYQILRSDYTKPNSEKSSIIWDNWAVGIKQLSAFVDQLHAGTDFTQPQLQNVHRGFFTLSDEHGDYAHRPDPGLLKPPAPNDVAWWNFASEADAQAGIQVVAKINAKYEAMGIFSNAKGPKDIRYPLHIRLSADGTYGIFSGDSQASADHLAIFFRFMATMMKQAREKSHLVWNRHLMTPGEVAFFAQKFYVEIHPFQEGNGRTSRFIQEMILNFYDFPYGSSGDLMDSDILTTHEEYYQSAINATDAEMNRLGECMHSYKDNLNRRVKKVKDIEPSLLDYDCRLLPSRR